MFDRLGGARLAALARRGAALGGRQAQFSGDFARNPAPARQIPGFSAIGPVLFKVIEITSGFGVA
jgi:hypothetical protein